MINSWRYKIKKRSATPKKIIKYAYEQQQQLTQFTSYNNFLRGMPHNNFKASKKTLILPFLFIL
jgi:hypothetical protein